MSFSKNRADWRGEILQALGLGVLGFVSVAAAVHLATARSDLSAREYPEREALDSAALEGQGILSQLRIEPHAQWL